jgi:hypothetical protein
MRGLFVIIWLTSSLVCNAQLNQFSGRFGINGKVKLSKKLALNTGIQLRSDISNLQYRSTNFFLDGTYRLAKPLKVGLNYRNLIQPNEHALLDGEKQAYRNRFQLEVCVSPFEWLHWDKYIDIEWRTLMQFEQFKFKRNQLTWRNKLTIKPILKKSIFNPYLSAELFYRFNQFSYFIDEELITQGLLNEFRYCVGTEVKLSKNDAIDLGVMFRDFQTSRPSNLTLMVTYIHDFGRIFKKD